MSQTNDPHLPLGWYVFLACLLLLGALLLWVDSPEIAALSDVKLFERRQIVWAPLLGVLLLAVPCSHLLAYGTVRLTKGLFALEGNNNRAHLWPPALIGVVESILYPSALLLGKGEFIGVWLALKVAGQWGRWSVSPPPSALPDEALEKIHEGRRRYYQSLIGNAISVMLGAVTYLAVIVVATRPPPAAA